MMDEDEVGTTLQLHGGSDSLVGLEAGVASQAAREESEVKAAVVLARNFPRDEQAAFVAMQRSAKRPTFALGALYSFPRGGKAITGPSVKMAREMARCWGNLQHGIRLLSMDADYVHVEGWAWDLQTNTRVGSEAKFKRLIQRGDGWVEPDERDLRELVNKHGAVCVRNSILQLMAPDVVDELERMCLATNQKAAEGDIEEDRDQVLRSLAAAFSNMGVTTKMLEQYVGHALEVITPAELVDLRAVFTALRDGTAERGAYFDLPGGGAQSKASSKLEEKLRAAHADEDPAEDAAAAKAASVDAQKAMAGDDMPASPTVQRLRAEAEERAENAGGSELEGVQDEQAKPEPNPYPSGIGGAKTKTPSAGKVDLVARAKAAREKATQEQAELEEGDEEVRVVDGQWVGAYPNLKEDLPRILGKIDDPQVVVNMLLGDGRKKGVPLYMKRLCRFDLLAVLKVIPEGEAGDDVVIELLGVDDREGSENRLVASLKARGIDIGEEEDDG